jgi:DNA invertase Pin-like site-specific DNA recombinase
VIRLNNFESVHVWFVGDTLHVHSIDRLARNILDLQTIVNDLVKRGVAVKFHKENLVFTGDASPMQELMLELMGAFAQFERSLIRERQREGIAAAKAAGKQIGAPSKLNPEIVTEILAKLETNITKKALAEQYGISRTTLYKIIYNQKEVSVITE